MTSWLRALVLVLPTLAAAAADDGQLPAEGMLWRCWYDLEVHITCTVESRPGGGTMDDPASPLPAVVQEMSRNLPTTRLRFIHIPLHTEPDDMAFVAELAGAIVCGSRPDCAVNFSATPPSGQEIEALLKKNFPPD